MSETALVVKTVLGEVRGVEQGATVCFRGIRYGAPTGGASRFRPPTPAAAWDGVLDAVTDSPTCPQLPMRLPAEIAVSLGLGVGGNDAAESEDCLGLNLWTPGLDDARRPVMVWLHGGGYAVGAGTWPIYDGERLATRGDTVIVCLNHRLGALGYLELSEIGGDQFKGSGNAGNLDIVLALEWVRDNIAGFGGDPDNVTIFGESGGGRKVTKLLTMPAARGLFHRAIIQSGAQPYTSSLEAGTQLASQLMEKLGARDVEALQAVPVDEIARTMDRYMPVVDGEVLPRQPIDSMLAGRAADVPVMVGTTQHEAALFGLLGPGTEELDDAGIVARLREQLGDEIADAVLPVYESERPGITAKMLRTTALTDRDRRIPAIRVAEALSSTNRSNIFMYVFGYPGTHPEGLAPHGSDVVYTFDHSGFSRPDDAEAQHVADQWAGALLAFARSGDPNHRGMATTWAPYDTDRRATQIFDSEARAVDDPWAAERAAWEGLPVTGML